MSIIHRPLAAVIPSATPRAWPYGVRAIAREIPHSCSTFALSSGDAHYVGHNLDDYYDVAGMVTVNTRGVLKESISWEDLDPRSERDAEGPRVRWISKYGSITGNTFGREFVDGGMNEAGLCVSEMTLMGTVWPEDSLPKIYHHQWMQYLLDNFDSVGAVIESLKTLSISGHCQWHFFVADRAGDAAVIEFLEGKAIIHHGETMPVKVLCNATYAEELQKLSEFQGYGGTRDLGIRNKEVDNRFVWAASLINAYPASGATDPVAYSFDILRELDCGNNQWSLVYDLTHGTMYVRTAQARDVRFVRLASFDLSCASQVLALDIHRGLEGDVSHRFGPYTDDDNRAFIQRALEPIDTSPLGENFKARLCYRLSEYTRGLTCAE
jgi:penicillin V acylase-like amidase (Ntn superfamily)